MLGMLPCGSDSRECKFFFLNLYRIIDVKACPFFFHSTAPPQGYIYIYMLYIYYHTRLKYTRTNRFLPSIYFWSVALNAKAVRRDHPNFPHNVYPPPPPPSFIRHFFCEIQIHHINSTNIHIYRAVILTILRR